MTRRFNTDGNRMLNKTTRTAVLMLCSGLLAVLGGCGGAEDADTGEEQSPAAAGQPAEPESPGSDELRREIEALDRQRLETKNDRESLESELEALSAELDESESEATRLEAKVRRLEEQAQQ